MIPFLLFTAFAYEYYIHINCLRLPNEEKKSLHIHKMKELYIIYGIYNVFLLYFMVCLNISISYPCSWDFFTSVRI
jgi:hypothetical protein